MCGGVSSILPPTPQPSHIVSLKVRHTDCPAHPLRLFAFLSPSPNKREPTCFFHRDIILFSAIWEALWWHNDSAWLDKSLHTEHIPLAPNTSNLKLSVKQGHYVTLSLVVVVLNQNSSMNHFTSSGCHLPTRRHWFWITTTIQTSRHAGPSYSSGSFKIQPYVFNLSPVECFSPVTQMGQDMVDGDGVWQAHTHSSASIDPLYSEIRLLRAASSSCPAE